MEQARRIREQPQLLEAGRQHLERFARHDPGQRAAYALWDDLLNQGPGPIAAALLDRSAAGDYARETAPSFGAIPAPTRADLLQQAKTPLPAPNRGDAA